LLDFKDSIVKTVTRAQADDPDFRQQTFFAQVEHVTVVNRDALKESDEEREELAAWELQDQDNMTWLRADRLHLKDANPSMLGISDLAAAKEKDLILENKKILQDPNTYLQTKKPQYFDITIPKYGPCRVWIFESIHDQYPTRYLVINAQMPEGYSGTSKNAIWISAMEPAREDLKGQTPYLTPRRFFSVPLVTTPLLEKPENFPGYNDPRCGKFHFEFSRSTGDLIMWNALKRVPAIMAFAAKISGMVQR
jgi:hypothetical protein